MAIHEAGHAVVSLAVGKDVCEVRIEESGGFCVSYVPGQRRSWHACSALAGVLACRIHCRELSILEEWNSWDNCHEDMRLFNEQRGGMSYRQGRRLALSILREREHLLLELASILERDGYIDHDNAPAELRS